MTDYASLLLDGDDTLAGAFELAKRANWWLEYGRPMTNDEFRNTSVEDVEDFDALFYVARLLRKEREFDPEDPIRFVYAFDYAHSALAEETFWREHGRAPTADDLAAVELRDHPTFDQLLRTAYQALGEINSGADVDDREMRRRLEKVFVEAILRERGWSIEGQHEKTERKVVRRRLIRFRPIRGLIRPD